ncbi:polymer-forming cytoskeletal protein [Brevibacillus composti]|uniref:Polymer-forming cytoskeletal protein n=1 Tax=Brevibacillus composti TaxID=2796470 RepID=A0A7T5EK27_9BACL|nr:polymer-forming cytoskeletal protein [Brevibacillus composti]QQE74036.1 polymer-forming cytoskeletal protein [Brevibacillus composti]QUO41120.1 polymer-forming cytoskeletal protein [Brevibacillus composti]
MRRMFALILLTSLLLVSSVAYAFSGVAEERYYLAQESVHRGDLAVSAARTVIEGVVDGDLYVFSENVQIKGKITGDLFSFAATTIVSGKVEGDIRSVTDTLLLNGEVGGSVASISNHLLLEPNGRIGKNLLMLAANADLLGEVSREANGMADSIRISGKVGEGISMLHARTIRLDAPAEIGGDLVYTSPGEAMIAPGVTIAGKVSFTPMEPVQKTERFSYFPLLLGLASLLCTLLMWLAVRYLFPAGLAGISRQLDQGGRSLYLWGLILMLGIPLLSLILLITMVGIPVAVLLMAAYSILVWAAKVFVGAWLGIRLAERFHWRLSPLLAELVGVFLLQCLMTIPLIGWLLALPVWAAFLGALAGVVVRANKTFLR